MRRAAFVIALAFVVVIALAVSLALGTGPEPGMVAPGAVVAGIPVGGLSFDDASDLIETETAARLARPIEITVGETGTLATPASLGLSVDGPASVEQALGTPSEGSLFGRTWRRLTGRVDETTYPLVISVDEIRLNSATDELALRVERLVKDARIFLDDGRPKAVAAETGLLLDRGALLDSLEEALESDSATVSAVLVEVPPEVTTEDAQAALDQVRGALSSPLTLAYQGATFDLSPEELAAMAAPNPGGMGTGLPITFDTDEARDLLAVKLAAVQSPPIEAEIVPGENGRGFSVRPGQDGTLVEWSALLPTMTRVALEDGRRYVPIPTTVVRPRLSTTDAQQLSERREVASFTTYFSPANAARVNNIRQVAKILDGSVIRPGETFSFNKTVGPRTRAAGFDEAPVIRDGVLTPGVGGGICQVSTTLFNAAFFAGLPVVDRKPHSFYIDHYPVGRDATVSYGSTDLKFRNDSDAVLLLTITTTEQSVTASLAAPEWDRTVAYETSDFFDIVEPRSSLEHPRRLRDPALPRGTMSEIEAGVTGRSVVVERTVSDSKGMLFQDSFRSVYSPKDYVIRVGG